MSNGRKEIAKFACGVEAFHAFTHAYFWYSGKTLHAFGVRETPTWHKRAAIGNALLALALGVYAWREGTAAARTSAVPSGSDICPIQKATAAEQPQRSGAAA